MSGGPYPWKFTQLGGQKTVLTLDGYNAPYGRPRKGPVAERERELRESETYCPGSDIPTRHIFGTKQTPIVLTGRFMDSRIGVNAAQQKADEVDLFVAAKIPCRMEWGGILAFTGLLTKFKCGYEADDEIIWTLTAKIDQDDTKPIQAPITPPQSAAQLLATVTAHIDQTTQAVAAIPPDIEYQPSFLDTVNQLVGSVRSLLSVPLQFADSVDNYESTLDADTEAFIMGTKQLQTAVTQLQITMQTGANDVAIAKAQASSQIAWFQQQTTVDLLLLAVLGDLGVAIVAAEQAQKGSTDTTVRANGGDTWESLALTNLGSASKADALRQANGARYATPPMAGQRLHIPQKSA